MKKFFIILFGISLTLNSLAQVTTLDTVNVGAVPNDGTGDPLRTAFQKLNANDQELNHYTPILVGDSMDVVRATLRSDINDTADILRAEWRSDINDSLPDSVLYATYAGTALAIDDTITFSGDQYFLTSDNNVYYEMTQSNFILTFDQTEAGFLKVGYIGKRCEGFQVSAYNEDPDSLDLIFDATQGFAIWNSEDIGGDIAAIKLHPDSIRIEGETTINNTLNVDSVVCVTIPTIYQAAGDTSNYNTPEKVGDVFIDTSSGDIYISKGTSRGDWIKLNYIFLLFIYKRKRE